MKNLTKPFLELIFVLAGVLLLCGYAFYNRYPLAYSDTGAYIEAGFTMSAPADRPIFYGVFIWLTSLGGTTLWFPVFAQSLLLNLALMVFIRRTNTVGMNKTAYLGILLLLAYCTAVSSVASLLLADVFTPIAALCFLSLSICRLAKIEKGGLAALLLLALTTHLSHVVLFTLACCLAIPFLFVPFLKRWFAPQKTGLMLCSLCILAAWLIIPYSNYLDGKGFVLSPAAPVFRLCKFAEQGVLQQYLARKCEQEDHLLCSKANEFKGMNFNEALWNENSPINQLGGMNANRKTYSDMVSEIYSSPEYWD